MDSLLNSNFDTFFNDMFGEWGIKKSKIPPVDVSENSTAFYIEAELPGYKEEDVNVHVEQHVLHISSKKQIERTDKNYIIKERNCTKFDRAFSLPEGIDEEKIEATFADGMLNITLPKSPVEQPKKININFKH